MNKLIKYAVGIDLAKDKMDVCMMSIDSDQNCKIKSTHKFANTKSGFKELDLWCKKHCKEQAPLQILVEATGVYYENVAIYMTDKGYNLSVVLPNKARSFMKSLGLKSKNDAIDAQGLAMMCAQRKCEQWQPVSKYYYQLRQLTRRHQNIQEIKTIANNQLHANEYCAWPSKEIRNMLKKTIAMYDAQLDGLVKLIDTHIAQNEEVQRKVNQICLIKGVGTLTVATIIAETNGFQLFKNIRQLVSYSGYDVVENQSGSHVGKTKISKKGNSHIRRILYMPAINMVTHEQHPFVNLYYRVFERTKITMKGYVAVQKKLLTIIYSLWTKDEAYNPKKSQKDVAINLDATQPVIVNYKFTNGENGEAKKIAPALRRELHKMNSNKGLSKVLSKSTKLSKTKIKNNSKADKILVIN